MEITRKSPFSGKVRTVEIPVTQEQLDAWSSGELAQNAMPHLSPEDREFIMTGIAADEWDSLFDCKDIEDEMEVDDDAC